MSSEVTSRSRICPASLAESLPRATAFSMYFSMRARPASSASGRTSWRTTVPPVRATAVRKP